jgi:hypothetical protein
VGETLTELAGVRRGLESAESRSEMAMEVAEAACRSYGYVGSSAVVWFVYGDGSVGSTLSCTRARTA